MYTFPFCSVSPPFFPQTCVPVQCTCAHTSWRTLDKPALSSQKTNNLCCSVLENLKHTTKRIPRLLSCLVSEFEFRISFEKCPGLENHKWIDQIYPLFLELRKGHVFSYLQDREELRVGPDPLHFAQSWIDLGKRNCALQEQTLGWERVITTHPTFKEAPPYKISLLLLQISSVLCSVKEEVLGVEQALIQNSVFLLFQLFISPTEWGVWICWQREWHLEKALLQELWDLFHV